MDDIERYGVSRGPSGAEGVVIYASHPECGARLLPWPEMLLPGDLRCRRCGLDIDPADETCDASVASGQPHHMQCPAVSGEAEKK